jgi:hypothetical protein
MEILKAGPWYSFRVEAKRRWYQIDSSIRSVTLHVWRGLLYERRAPAGVGRFGGYSPKLLVAYSNTCAGFLPHALESGPRPLKSFSLEILYGCLLLRNPTQEWLTSLMSHFLACLPVYWGVNRGLDSLVLWITEFELGSGVRRQAKACVSQWARLPWKCWSWKSRMLLWIWFVLSGLLSY